MNRLLPRTTVAGALNHSTQVDRNDYDVTLASTQNAVDMHEALVRLWTKRKGQGDEEDARVQEEAQAVKALLDMDHTYLDHTDDE